VEDVPGRIEDIFHYAGGVVVHPIVFDSILGREACILEYRVQQTDAGADIEVVAAGNADLDALRSSLESDLSARGLTDASVTIRRVARIRAQTGKLKQFVAK
jgi:phenylacetate-coenzyme A ligase PaaK-like adenylate-forming protein